MLETLRTSFKSLSVNLWIPSISYVLLSLVPFTLGIEMIGKLMEVSENSMILNTLVDRFDYAIFTDFWRLHHAQLNPVLLKAAWSLPIVWLIKVFITGGNLDAVNEKHFSLSRYLTQCKKYFWRMFRLDILLFCIVIVLLILCVLFLSMLVRDIDGKNEIQLLYRIAPPVCIFLLFYFIFSICKDFAAQKIYFTANHAVRKNFFESVKYIFSNLRWVLFQVILSIFGLIWLYLYVELDAKIKGSGMATAILIVCLQQFYVLGKHFLRAWHLFIVQIVQDKRAVS